ncbi:MAG: DUF1326 domain-containing protein [Gemmataceae bacterium]
MTRSLAAIFCAVAFLAPVSASQIVGQYIEARTCDVWTGPCFANADVNLVGKHAVIGWKIEKGALGSVLLDGLSVVAVVEAKNTLGFKQNSPAKVAVIVDNNADSAQRQALLQLVKKQGGKLFSKVVSITSADIDINICQCKNNTCAELTAGAAKVKTRCLHKQHDKVCGNETAYYPPLSIGVKATAAAILEHSYTGNGLGGTWRDFDGRGAYVGTFTAK